MVIKRKAEIKDLDEKTIGELNQRKEDMENSIFDDEQVIKKKCIHCHSEEVVKVFPEIKMGELTLFECKECKERFYL